MIDFRCKKCDKLLGRVDGNADIVCTRCGGINKFDFKTKKIEYVSKLKKQSERTTLSGKRFD